MNNADASAVTETVSFGKFDTDKKEDSGDKKIRIIKAVFGILCFFL